MIDLVEARYPGAAGYFHSPLWQVLKKEPIDQFEIDRALLQLGRHVTLILVKDGKESDPQPIDFNDFTPEVIQALVQLGDFLALTVVVLTIAKSERIASIELRDAALKCYKRLAPKIAQLPEMQGIGEELLMRIDIACKHWVHPTTQTRMEIAILTSKALGLFGHEPPKPL